MRKRPSHRPNVGAILRREDGHILMCERLNQPGHWQFPQGGIKKGERLFDALWREIEEELGLSPATAYCRIIAVGPEVKYDFPPGTTSKIATKYAGQAQVLVLLDYLGCDSDLQLAADDKPEFRSFRWVTRAQALQLLWENKRPGLLHTLEALQEQFNPDTNE